MMRTSMFCSLPLFLYVVYMRCGLLSAENAEDFTTNAQFLETLKNSHHDLSAIKSTLDSLDKDLETYQKRTCGFGLNSRQCALSHADKLMSATGWLNSGHSPGKRSASSVDDPAVIERLQRVLDNISRQRQHLRELTSMIQQVNGQPEQRKRTCMFNLGGSCATELASAIADQYYYLNGPSSPGRRRKRASPKAVRPITDTKSSNV